MISCCSFADCVPHSMRGNKQRINPRSRSTCDVVVGVHELRCVGPVVPRDGEASPASRCRRPTYFTTSGDRGRCAQRQCRFVATVSHGDAPASCANETCSAQRPGSSMRARVSSSSRCGESRRACCAVGRSTRGQAASVAGACRCGARRAAQRARRSGGAEGAGASMHGHGGHHRRRDAARTE
jgi:hypothetical protein